MISDDLLNKLKNNTMFRLSLGSKELFHSNFLEFLWDTNKEGFLEMLKDMIPSIGKQIDSLLEKKDELKIAREKENFDLCIYHEVTKKRKGKKQDDEGEEMSEIYDIIIENKVKSIPYKEQLDGYAKKVEEHNKKIAEGIKPSYILLSLAKEFSQKAAISKTWNIIHYDALAKSIKIKYDENDIYINDYVTFISNLDELGAGVIESRENTSDVQKSIQEKLTPIRLHDLYLKLRGSIFIGEVYEKIINKINKISFESADRKRNDIKIFLNSTMNNGKATVDAAIAHVNDNDKIFYVIQIEGNQYRHMINKVDLAKNCSYIPKGNKRPQISENEVKKELKDQSFEYKFLNFLDSFSTNLDKKNLHHKYCKYQPNIVYRYNEFDRTLESMLETMVNDIVSTCNALEPQK